MILVNNAISDGCRSVAITGRMDLRVGGVKFRAAYNAKKSFLAKKISEYFFPGHYGDQILGSSNIMKLKDIASPFFALCVSSYFWIVTGQIFVLVNFNKNLGFGLTPQPLFGTKSCFYSEFFWPL